MSEMIERVRLESHSPPHTCTPAFSRPSPFENGARPVHTITASTSSESTGSFVVASIISTTHGLRDYVRIT